MLKKVKQFLEDHKYKILAGISFAFAGYAFYKYLNDDNRIKLSSFLDALKSNQLDEVIVQGDTVYFKSHISDWYYTTLGTYPVSMLFQQLKQSEDLKFACESDNEVYKNILTLILSAGISLLGVRLLMPQKFGTIKKHPKIIHNNQNFQNFYGSEQIKLKLAEIVDFLKNKQKYQIMGGRRRKGILFHGPPGTGKTMLAKTLANVANLPFIQTCGAQFQQIYVGVGPKKIRQLFQRAKSCPEGCIIFIDELDAIGSRGEGMRYSRQTTATINQLLTELDGFEDNQNIVVIGATNRIDLVDGALIRAGRFDIKVRLHLPDTKQRKGILKTLLKKKNVPHNLSLQTQEQIAFRSEGWSGADLQALINEGIYKAVRKSLPILENQQIINAFNQMLQK